MQYSPCCWDDDSGFPPGLLACLQGKLVQGDFIASYYGTYLDTNGFIQVHARSLSSIYLFDNFHKNIKSHFYVHLTYRNVNILGYD